MGTKRTAHFSWLQLGLWLALGLVLLGSIRNVAWSFAIVSGGSLPWGYIKAIGLDVGLALLAWGIHVRKRQRQPTAVLWAGVGGFSLISAYANFLFGVSHLPPGLHPLAVAAPWLLAAVLPAMVLYLAEIAGQDYAAVRQAQEQEQRQAARATIRGESVTPRVTKPIPPEDNPLGKVTAALPAGGNNGGPAWHAHAWQLRRGQPHLPQKEIAAACGVSPSRVSRLFQAAAGPATELS